MSKRTLRPRSLVELWKVQKNTRWILVISERQVKHRRRDSALPAQETHITCPQGITAWVFGLLQQIWQEASCFSSSFWMMLATMLKLLSSSVIFERRMSEASAAFFSVWLYRVMQVFSVPRVLGRFIFYSSEFCVKKSQKACGTWCVVHSSWFVLRGAQGLNTTMHVSKARRQDQKDSVESFDSII